MITRIKLWAVATAALFLAFFTFVMDQRRRSAAVAVDRVSRRAQVAAEARNAKREEIDASPDADASRERLRKHWTD